MVIASHYQVRSAHLWSMGRDYRPVEGLEHLLTADELAEYLAIPLATIQSWRKRGLGPLTRSSLIASTTPEAKELSVARISAFSVVDLPERPVLSVRATINAMRELTQWLGQGIDAVQGRLDELDARPAGVPFACFRGSDMTAMDVETAFPTAVTPTGSG